MLGSKKILALTIVAAIIIGAGAALLVLTGDQQVESEIIATQPKEKRAGSQVPNPTNNSSGIDLILPFNISDIDEQNGEVNPLGVVRFNKDQAEYGHSGIDIPLKQGAPIYAVADGPIVLVKPAGDPWGGQGMFQLLQATASGEGLAFIYEHITPAAGVKNGSEVKAGDLIGTKTAPAGFTAHFQLSNTFNNYEFIKGMECWVDNLNKSSSSQFLTWWNQYRASSKLVNSWRTNEEEGKFPFRGLLDATWFPDGPKLCYSLGTDVR